MFLLFAALTVPCPSTPQLRGVSTQDLIADPEVVVAVASVEKLFRSHAASLPTGMVATIVFDQTIVATLGFGRRGGANGTVTSPPRPTDLVRIASITKVFTDVLAYKLRDAGVVNLDDPIESFMPGFALGGRSGKTRGRITLRNLASHLSGLPREAPWPCSLDEEQCTEDDVLRLLHAALPVLPPYRRFHYSNLGIALLGRALAHAATVSNKPAWPLHSPSPSDAHQPHLTTFEALLEREVLAPLQMANATFDTAVALAHDRVAIGSTVDGRTLNLTATCTPASAAPGSWLAPCGCLWASATDLARLLQLFFRDGVAAGATPSQVLDGDTLHELLSPQVLLRDGYEAVGSPWEMDYASGVWVKSKQGELPGYRSSVSLVEPLKLGIFASALVSDVPSPTVWTLDALNILVPSVISALRRLQPTPALPRDASLLVGRYCGGRMSVAIEGGTALVLRIGASGKPLELSDGVEGIVATDATNDGKRTTSIRALRAHPVRVTEDCRHLDDGSDLEIAYFTQAAPDANATSVRFMDSLCERALM